MTLLSVASRVALKAAWHEPRPFLPQFSEPKTLLKNSLPRTLVLSRSLCYTRSTRSEEAEARKRDCNGTGQIFNYRDIGSEEAEARKRDCNRSFIPLHPFMVGVGRGRSPKTGLQRKGYT